MTTKATLDRLASLGEEVIGKASQNPNLNRVVQGAMQLKDRVDDLSKRVRGLEGMEKKINELEKRVAKLEGAKKRATSSSASKSATKKTESEPST
jgi:cell division septum initiation protein DivIVA